MKTTDKLDNAIKLVNEAIAAERARLEEIANTEEADPIMLEGITSTGHLCQMMVDPKDVATILLESDYPTYHVLQEDYPEDMWLELGLKYGLREATHVDI